VVFSNPVSAFGLGPIKCLIRESVNLVHIGNFSVFWVTEYSLIETMT